MMTSKTKLTNPRKIRAAFFAPRAAKALTTGSLIKASLSTLYYYAADGKRYIFPNEKTYFSWYENFDGVVTISDTELQNINIGGNIVYRPGTRWVKIQSDPKTYAVTPHGVLR